MMDGAFIRLLNAPAGLRRLIALSIGLLGLAMASLLIILPLAALQNAKTDLLEKREELGRLNSIVENAPAIPTTQASIGQGVFVDGRSEGAVQAGLQRFLTAIMGQSRQRIAAIGPAPSFTMNEVRYIGITANVSGTQREISRLLIQLETADPPLWIRTARLTSRNHQSNGAKERETQLTVQLEIFGAVDPKEPV